MKKTNRKKTPKLNKVFKKKKRKPIAEKKS